MTLPLDQTAADIAEIFDVDEQTVRGWAKEGCPHTRKDRRIWFNDGQMQEWIAKRGKSTKPGRPPKPKPEPTEGRDGDKDYWLARKYKNACLREEGELIPVSDVKKWIGEHVTTAKNRLIGLGAAIAPHLEGRDAAERQSLIDARVTEILNELSST